MAHKLILFLLLGIAGIVKSQNFPQNPMQGGGVQSGGFDSSEVSRDSARVLFFTNSILHDLKPNRQLLRRTLDGYHRHHPIFRSQLFNSSLGNMGQAFHPLTAPQLNDFGFVYGLNPYDLFRLSDQNSYFYEAQSPFTEAFYVIGSGQEQYFRLIHTQNINKNWNIGLHYQKVNSIGLYNRQRTNHTAFRIFSSYFSANKRYQLLVSAAINDLKVQENGGITALGDTLFRDNIEQNRTIIPVELLGASNRSFQNGVNASHQYRFSKDSSNFAMALFQNFTYDFNRFSIEDIARPEQYYPAVFNESTFSTDHYFNKWSQALGLKLSVSKQFKDSSLMIQQLCFSIDNESANVSMKTPLAVLSNNELLFFSNDTAVFNNSFSLRYDLIIEDKLSLNSNYKQMFSGANAGDFLFLNQLSISLAKGLILRTDLNLQNRTQNYFFNHFVSNHSRWFNNFSRTQHLSFKSSLVIEKLGLSVGFSQNTISNPVVINALGAPIQLDGTTNISALELSWYFKYKKLFFENHLIAQTVNGADAIRLPALHGRSGFYFKGFYKGKTEIRLGLDLFYVNAFSPMNYNPYLGHFSLQNEYKSSNIAMFDVYVSASIKRARVFARLEHVNAGLGQFNYVMVQGYPLSDRVFKIGLNWLFFD